MTRLETHNQELRRLLGFMVGFTALSAATYLVPGSEVVQPWVPGEPVPLVHLILGDQRVVETHPGVLVTQRGGSGAGPDALPMDEWDTGAPEDVGGAVAVEPAADPSPVAAVADAAPLSEADVGFSDVTLAEDPGEAVASTGSAEPTLAEDAPAEAGLDRPDAVAADLGADADPDAVADLGAANAPTLLDDHDALAAAALAPLEAAPVASGDSAEPDTGRRDTGTPEGAAAPRRDARLPDRAPARGTPIEMPPGAMDAWFSALARAEAGEPGQIARALHWGDSTIAGDGITRTVRRRLQGRFGDGGPGFLAVQVDPRWSSRPGIIRQAKGAWKTLTITFGGAEMAYYGLAGTVSTASGASSSTLQGRKIDGERQPLHRFDLFFQVQPGGGSFYASPKGAEGVGVSTAHTARGDGFRELLAPEGSTALTITTSEEGPVTLYGVALETEGPGMTWETFGVAGAGSGSMFRQGRNHIARQIARREPHLLVYQMGGNELGLPVLKSGDGSGYRDRYVKALSRVLAGAPEASCLIITPLDQGERYRGGIRSKPTLDKLVQIQREVAWDHGCAFWDARGAMGGANSFVSWLGQEPALAWSDLHHLTNRGLNIMGHTLSDAIELAYDDWKAAGGASRVTRASD